ncbi:MAG: hypothetical protein PUC33_05255 [Oscillospiraceae bacterium]|nr:hypothetical protein [Oscillospiraceae bacterium]
MKEICEIIMLLCFGISWPISVYKSIVSKSTQGKSVVFIAAIIIGYLAGILGKIVSGQINYVLILYCFNLAVVSLDLILYFRNKAGEKKSTPAVTAKKQTA